MTKIKLFISSLATSIAFLLFFLVSTPVALAAGPTLLIAPTSETIPNGATKTFTININTADQQIFGADAVITYNPQALEVTAVTKGAFFSDFNSSKDNTAGKIELHGYFDTLDDYRSGSGSLGTFVVKAKKDSGSATMSLICNSSANTSQIINKDGNNILPCAEVNTTMITMTNSSGATPTPTPTGTNGDIPPSCNGLSVSPTTGNKPLTVSFACAGSDADNDVTAAEFDIGNGNKKLVEKNIGQFGSIVTTYTYQTAGTYTVTCRVRDNIQKFSSIPDICKRSVTVKTTTTATSSSAGSATASNSADPIVYTGTTEEEVLQPYATPTPVLRATPTPIQLPTAKGNDKLFQIGTILLVTMVTIAAGLILRRMMGGPDI